MIRQLDLFDNVDPLPGIEVQLPRRCPCGHGVFRLGPGQRPHRASLHCARCGAHSGWLPNEASNFVAAVIERFGRPTAPITISHNHRVDRQAEVNVNGGH